MLSPIEEVKAQRKDRENMYAEGEAMLEDKVGSVLAANAWGIKRLADELLSLTVDWVPFVLVNPQVARILSELVGSANQHRFLPLITQLTLAKPFIEMFCSQTGRPIEKNFPKLQGVVKSAILAAKLQMAASTVCQEVQSFLLASLSPLPLLEDSF